MIGVNTMNKFIYVFNKEAKRLLENAGFVLLKEDEFNSTYVFVKGDLPEDSEKYTFALSQVSYIPSDTLTF